MAATTVSAVALAFRLGGALEICLCDPDPDGCGETCHDCPDGHTGEEADDCAHVSVRVDAPAVAPTGVDIPAVPTAPPPVAAAPRLLQTVRRLPAPPSTAPPDPGGTYAFRAPRLHPRS